MAEDLIAVVIFLTSCPCPRKCPDLAVAWNYSFYPLILSSASQRSYSRHLSKVWCCREMACFPPKRMQPYPCSSSCRAVITDFRNVLTKCGIVPLHFHSMRLEGPHRKARAHCHHFLVSQKGLIHSPLNCVISRSCISMRAWRREDVCQVNMISCFCSVTKPLQGNLRGWQELSTQAGWKGQSEKIL